MAVEMTIQDLGSDPKFFNDTNVLIRSEFDDFPSILDRTKSLDLKNSVSSRRDINKSRKKQKCQSAISLTTGRPRLWPIEKVDKNTARFKYSEAALAAIKLYEDNGKYRGDFHSFFYGRSDVQIYNLPEMYKEMVLTKTRQMQRRPLTPFWNQKDSEEKAPPRKQSVVKKADPPWMKGKFAGGFMKGKDPRGLPRLPPVFLTRRESTKSSMGSVRSQSVASSGNRQNGLSRASINKPSIKSGKRLV